MILLTSIAGLSCSHSPPKAAAPASRGSRSPSADNSRKPSRIVCSARATGPSFRLERRGDSYEFQVDPSNAGLKNLVQDLRIGLLRCSFDFGVPTAIQHLPLLNCTSPEGDLSVTTSQVTGLSESGERHRIAYQSLAASSKNFLKASMSVANEVRRQGMHLKGAVLEADLEPTQIDCKAGF